MMLVNALSFCQKLEYIAPVLTKPGEGKINKNVSFVLTTDPRLNDTRDYANCIEIIDADEPWPPRWYLMDSAWKRPEKTDTIFPDVALFQDARFQSGHFTFYKNEDSEHLNRRLGTSEKYVICNDKLQPVDSVVKYDLPLNGHDLRINNKGEKLFLARLDTTLDLRKVSGNDGDSDVRVIVDVIEILDSNNNLVFRWNASDSLGNGAIFYPYGSLMSLSMARGHLDWSHGNTACWDFDGNILYSFRSVGIGKISREDGHVIWRMDRFNVPFHTPTDDIAFYLQHAFDKLKDYPDHTTYTLYSNGDFDFPRPSGLIISVSKKDSQISLVKKTIPDFNYFAHSAGNYEVQENGDYIFNYGAHAYASNVRNPFMEYSDKHEKVYAQYSFPGSLYSYEVHQLNEWKPPRPEVVLKNKELTAKGEMKEWTWYKLSGDDNTVVTKAGVGAVFKPTENGVYCVAGKYGIGYSVSRPFYFKQ